MELEPGSPCGYRVLAFAGILRAMTDTILRQHIFETEATSRKISAVSEDGRFRIAVITPGMGSSGHYSAEVLKTAVEDGIFKKGTHSYVDHPSMSEQWDRPERSIMDLLGVLETDGVWEEEGEEGPGVYADVKIFERFVPMIRDMQEHIGMSIRAWCEGDWAEDEGGVPYFEITRFEMLESVDAVTHAGRGGAFVKMLESARGKPLRSSEKKVAGNLPSAKESVSSGATDHMEGNTKMDDDIKVAFEALNARFDTLPTAIGTAVAEAIKPAEVEAEAVDPLDAARAINTALAESKIPPEHHEKFYELVGKGYTAAEAVTFLSSLVGKPGTKQVGEAVVGSLIGRTGGTGAPERYQPGAGKPSAGSVIESLAGMTRRDLGIAKGA